MVRVERKILEEDQVLQPLNLLDQIEAEVEPAQLGQGLETLDLRDDVVVELQLDELIHTKQVVNVDDICSRREVETVSVLN